MNVGLCFKLGIIAMCVLLKTTDTDVVVPAEKIVCHKFFVTIGAWSHLQRIAAHEVTWILSPELAFAWWPMFNAFIICDTVSALVGRSKRTCQEVLHEKVKQLRTFHQGKMHCVTPQAFWVSGWICLESNFRDIACLANSWKLFYKNSTALKITYLEFGVYKKGFLQFLQWHVFDLFIRCPTYIPI